MAIYFPNKKPKRKIQQKHSQLAEIDDLIEMLQPERKNPIKKKIISTLRSKSNLIGNLSKKQLSKSPTIVIKHNSQNYDIPI